MEIVGVDQIEIFVVLSGNHGIAAIDLAGKQSHPLVARGRPPKRRHFERLEVRCGQQLGENRASSMPFDWELVTGKITRSLNSSSGPNATSTSSPLLVGVRLLIFGTDAKRAVGSTETLPYAAMEPDRKVSDETCPSPTARKLKMNRQPFSGAPVWSGCRTMLGLNRAEASNEYSLRK